MNLYIEQDGFYTTKNIILTYERFNNLAKDWYLIEYKDIHEFITRRDIDHGIFLNSILYACIVLFNRDVKEIYCYLEDNYIITKDMVLEMFPELRISGDIL